MGSCCHAVAAPEFVQLSSTAVALGTLCDDLTVAVTAVADREELAAYAAKHDAVRYFAAAHVRARP